MTINSVETYLENNESIIPSFCFMPIPVEKCFENTKTVEYLKGCGSRQNSCQDATHCC